MPFHQPTTILFRTFSAENFHFRLNFHQKPDSLISRLNPTAMPRRSLEAYPKLPDFLR